MEFNYVTAPLSMMGSWFVFWLIVRFIKGYVNFGSVAASGFINLVVSLMVSGFLYAHYKISNEVYVSKRVDIISLENVTGSSGNINGSAFGFSGIMQGSVTCNFVAKEPNGIRVISENVDNIIFHEIEGNQAYAEKAHWSIEYPFRLKKDKYHFKNTYTWNIFIPKESIKQYIKFN